MSELTPLAVAALGLLEERPMHPYEMYQVLMQRSEDRLLKVRPGSLYHAVDRLARGGHVRATGTEREGNRPERTTYEITDAGSVALQARLSAMLGEYVNEYPVFPLAIGESHNLAPDAVATLLEARLAGLRQELADYHVGRQTVTAKGLPEAYWLDIDYKITLLQTEIEWHQATIARLQSGDLTWNPEHTKESNRP
ncbi:PadR family transcriptional regulator [Schumannella luteola]|uniref:DNA-binding PadR family transcriptional regulator n=1 Tax=Schumannella luteola TaxID=472059 RepID=A0A852YAF5_9MICO|nr:PadR family transcriptional regulator [Schumannella luteola]NYG98264.1 DNA-binding PadR family transcriptional regulator [Schumannella luteola]TPX05707.1 PadR family transcriptional regulator [Schumannella luteola]